MKISCDVIRDLLPLYADEACSNDSRKIVEEHLAECPECSTMLRRLQSNEIENGLQQGNHVRRGEFHFLRIRPSGRFHVGIRTEVDRFSAPDEFALVLDRVPRSDGRLDQERQFSGVQARDGFERERFRGAGCKGKRPVEDLVSG